MAGEKSPCSAFWQPRHNNINDLYEKMSEVRCASQEYFGAVDLKALNLKVVTPVFMEDKGGTPKIVSFFAKKARGAMARYIIQHRLTDPAGLLCFDSGGYEYRADLSEDDKPVFVRPYTA
ncbi:YaaA family protein [Ruegeria sp.]|uniref:YaaA family protein n=1 Tax=Ruegeria sp. TaxID=1879320 RepID=UPI003AFF9C57